ncbi:hypothetical protein BJY01DRAFT_159830 [Aspergillus pseudoustus]|uniref:Zn(2)-C6 fungal-type domain-containing protein n=1 Tax=Aspergillus pseudoustus TaxID=1810923 RepID=A0ABR4K7V1_9EURO
MDGRGPYGLACSNCFKAKCKCVSRPEGPCERCHRLKKQCNPSDSVRRRNSSRTQSMRLAQLESKYESLLALLQQRMQPPPSAAPTPQHQQTSLHPNSAMQQPSPSDTLMPPPTGVAVGYPGPPDDLRNPEEVLALFRDHMLRFCPFIYLPPAMSAGYLQTERPFLWQAICAVTTRSFTEKRMRAHQFKTTLAQATVVENRSSIDLLLGVLTYAAWSYDQFLHMSPTISRLMEVALSIAYDMHLNKRMPPDSHVITLLGGRTIRTGLENPDHRSMEEQRGALGCFLLCSIYSTYFTQMDPMRWTSHMEGYLKHIEANPEHPNDQSLTLLVRLQLLGQRAAQMRDEHEGGPFPIAIFLNSFRAQLDILRNSLPVVHPNKDLLLLHLHYIELGLHTSAFVPEGSLDTPTTLTTTPPTATAAATTTTTTTTTPSPPGTLNPNLNLNLNLTSSTSWERIECMRGTLSAIQSWVDSFYQIPTAEYAFTPMILWTQFARALVNLYRLSTYTDPQWNPEVVTQTISLLDIVESVGLRVDQVAEAGARLGERDYFWGRVAGLSQLIRAWLREQIVGDDSDESPSAWVGGGGGMGGGPASVATSVVGGAGGSGSAHGAESSSSQSIAQSLPSQWGMNSELVGNLAYGNEAWLQTLSSVDFGGLPQMPQPPP